MKAIWKQYFYLYLFAITKVPMIFFSRPRIVNIDNKESRIVLPFKRRNRNHVGSMYIGTLTIGADLCVGLLAMQHIRQINPKIVVIFKDLSCEYLKKAMGPTEFICLQGEDIATLVKKSSETGQRQTQTLQGHAMSTVNGEKIHVMNFAITLSVK